jgi:hypothetical protein
MSLSREKVGIQTIVYIFESSLFHCLNTNIYSYLETSGGQSSRLYLKVVHFFKPMLIRHLWQLKTVVFLHWCLICAFLLAIVFVPVKPFPPCVK